MITIIVALISLGLIAFNKTCHTVSMMLVGNTCLAEFVWGCTCLYMALFALKNDIKRIEYEDSLCMFRFYLLMNMVLVHNSSYDLQAIYRYMIVLYPSNLLYQSHQFQICLILLTWLIALIFSSTFSLISNATYNAENQVCHEPTRLSFNFLYGIMVLYVIPVMTLYVIYFKLVRYVRKMSRRVSPANILSRAKRDLKMVRNLVTLLSMFAMLGVPYLIFFIMSIFTTLPKYHFRIVYITFNVPSTAVMITVFKTTDPLRNAGKKAITALINRIR
jgi:hypothetical protein